MNTTNAGWRALAIVFLAVLSIAMASCGSEITGITGNPAGGTGTGGGNSGTGSPTPSTGAFRWQVSLATSQQAACFRPGSALPLTVAAFTEGGQAISDPRYEVTSDVSGAVEPNGAGGWTVRGEGAARITVTYTGQTDAFATIAPVIFDVLRDGTAPQITISSPARGAMLIATDDIIVQGQATDATSPVQSLRVNGIEQVVTAGLNQPIAATPAGRWGLNIIEVVATDSCANSATLSQSYLRSTEYRPAATAANAGARVARGQTLKLTQTAVDDLNRSDLDDIATLTERYLQRNLSNELAGQTSGSVLASEAAGCPGVGYVLSVAPPGATVTGPRVRELELLTGSIRQDLSFQRITIPLRFVEVTNIGIPLTGCLTTTVPFSAALSANVTSLSTSVLTVAGNGRIDAAIPSLAVNLTDVQFAFTGVSFVDNILSSLAGLLTSRAEDAIEDVIRSALPPMLEDVLNTPLTASTTIAGGPFNLTLSAVAGLSGINVVPAATTETAFTQIYPGSVGTPYPALGAIARPTAAANLASNTGALTYAIDDNLINQGLWALWHGGALEIPDVMGFPGTALAASALLPPVLMPGAQPGGVAFGIGDLDVTLSLDLTADTLPGVTGHVEVEAYVSYLLDGTIGYDNVTKDLRLRAAPGDRRAYVHVRRISNGTDEITDAARRALIEEYGERLIAGSIEQFAEETLTSTLLPPLRFEFNEPFAGGTVDALELQVTALTRTADHVVLDIALAAEEPPAPQLEGYLTLNNHWVQQDLIDVGIPFVYWSNTPHMEDPVAAAVPARSVTVHEYHRTNRVQCEQDGDPVCLPQWRFPLNYGYYCGKGRPVNGFLGNPMLDPVDYCCRLHDRNMFNPVAGAANPQNACGFIMCLNQATGFPADITERVPDVERARRQMYNKGKLLCGPSVRPELPPPQIVPP